MTNTRSKLNMSDFLANLNASPTQSESKDDFSQLDLFANTDFLNFDLLEPLSSTTEFDSPAAQKSSVQSWNNLPSTEMLPSDYQFNPLTLDQSAESSTNFPIDPLFTLPAAQSIPPTPQPGAKRKLDLLDPTINPSERARIEAEEDKRRRNTAASARFRVKKKQREQALEKTAKDMTEKATKLEKRAHELELENKWLKGLITEKTGGKEFSELFAKFLAETGESSHSDGDEHKAEI